MGTTLNQSDQLRLSGILAELARLKGEYRGYSSVGGQPNGVRKFRVTQQAHGFIAGQWVYWDSPTSAWKLAQAETGITTTTTFSAFEPLVLIKKVPTADTMDVVPEGYVKLGASFAMAGITTPQPWTIYAIDPATPGSLVRMIDQDIDGDQDNIGPATRVACMYLHDGWYYLPGPITRTSHVHSMWDLYEVTNTDATVLHPGASFPTSFNAGDFFGYDGTLSTWKVLDGGNILIGKQTAPGVVGTIDTTSAYTAMIKPTGPNQVLGYDGTTIAWQSIGAASITNGSVTAVKIGADVFLETLKDVSITITPADSRVTNDFLTWNGTAWVNRNLGPIVCVPIPGSGAAVQSQMALDGGVTASVTSVVGVGHSGSRLYVGANCSLDFEILNTPSTNNEYALRMLTSSAGVKFYDRARGAADGTSAGALPGTEVMEWGSDANGGTRYFKFMIDAQFADTSINTLKIHAQGSQQWRILDSNGNQYLEFGPGSITQIVTLKTDLEMGTNKLSFNNGSFTVQASGGFLNFNSGGTPTFAIGGNTIGFFGTTPHTKVSVGVATTLGTTQTPNPTYGTNEQSMLSSIKIDLQNIYFTLSSLQSALSFYYGLV